MMGPDINDEELKGVIPRSISFIFEYIQNASEDLEFQISCSMLQI